MDYKEDLDKYTKFNKFDYFCVVVLIGIFVAAWFIQFDQSSKISLTNCKYSINEYSIIEEADKTTKDIDKYIDKNNNVVVNCYEFSLYVQNLSGKSYMVKEFKTIKKYPWEKGSLDGFKEDITVQTKKLIENVKFDEFNYDYVLDEKDVENIKLYSFE